MAKKTKVKKERKTIGVYVSLDEYDHLVKITDEQNKSLTEWFNEAMNMKLRYDSNDLNKEADRLTDYFSERAAQLKQEIKEEIITEYETPEILKKLYAKTEKHKEKLKNDPEYKKRFEGLGNDF